MVRIIATAAVLAALTLTAASCSEDDPDLIPGADESTPTTEATTTEPPWAGEYTEEQVEAYRAALRRYRAFDRESFPYLRDDVIVRPDAEAVWLKYWTRKTALTQFNEQMGFRAQGFRLKKAEDVVWARPKSISADGLRVTIKRCLDGPTAVIEQNGEQLDLSGAPLFVSTVDLVRKDTSSPWRISQYQEFPKRKCK